MPLVEIYMYLSFAAATAVMIFLPGLSVFLTVSHSITQGWRRALATAAGVMVEVYV
jgi:homoserine/homoserine lactone efflux protein